ncbi:MAG: acyltransferase [Deltaproteobacteria bacterium]|nr:acyltransferase [Deltaproteobacteria bacterium]
MTEDRFKDWKPPEFDERGFTKWNWWCQHHQNLKLGIKTDIGAFTYMNAKFGIEIGDYVQVASHCAIYSYSTIDNKKGKVIIKENAKIGSHCVIFPGITIGKNAIIGAGAVVTKDVPDNAVAIGIPAKVVRYID